MLERIDLSTVEAGRSSGVVLWPFADARVAGFFAGRGAPERGAPGLARLLPSGVSPAWLRQVHGARAREARPGPCGDGDALLVAGPGVAAIVAVADCVPVLVSTPGGALAIHAGWRGLVAGVVDAALARTEAPERANAWIGPAIGPCCYEVGLDVAERVAAVSDRSVVRPGPGLRPHLDLASAAAAQLVAAGVRSIRHFDLCTRCHPELLWSHRREGESAGRNLAAIWLAS
jgi:hypothetical protein